MGDLIINDECVTVSETEIRIPWYFFPFGQTKHIRLEEVRSVKGFREYYSLKTGWGTDFVDNTWWACDISRIKGCPAIQVDYGRMMKAGIAIKSGYDLEAFNHLLRTLRRLLPTDIEVSLDGEPVVAEELAPVSAEAPTESVDGEPQNKE